MAKGPKDFSQSAFDLVARTTGTPTTDDLAETERATRGAESRSQTTKAAVAKRWAPQE